MPISNKSFRILLVEDSPEDIVRPFVLTTKLGCDVTLAFDGKQAMNFVEHYPFDLVILDWNMPIMNGKDFLNGLRRTHKSIMNVVLYSGNRVSPKDIPESDKFRIVDQWQKPIGAVEMLHRIREIREASRR